MRIYPAVDLINGECVRLKKGCFTQKTLYSKRPLEVIKDYETKGFKYLHIVDLDGARQGKLQQMPLIKEIAKQTHLKVQVGGGVRSRQTVDCLLNAGVERVIIGSMAVTDKNQVTEWLAQYTTKKIVLALDIICNEQQIPQIVIRGWQQCSQVNLWQLLDFYQHFANLEILCTDVSRDGLLQGPNFELYQACYERFPQIKFLVSGGITRLSEINRLSALPNTSGFIVGTAIYENKIALEDLVNVG